MGVFEGIEEREGVPFLMTRVEKYDAVVVRIVIFLIPSQEHIGAQVWEYFTDTVDEHVGLL